MSGIGGGTGARGYDPIDLGRRIGVCFSAGELRRLAESLGVDAAVSWDRGTSEAARDLVRQFERKGDLEALVSRLREVRPLVEWPDPPEAVEAAPEGGGGFGVAPPLDGPGYLVGSEAAASPAAATSLGDPGEASATTAGAPAPPVPPAPPAPTVSEPIASSRAPLSAAAPSAGRAPGMAWPGMAEAPKESRGGLDTRLLILVPALTLLAAIVAYFAGRAGTKAETAPPAGTSAATESAQLGGPESAGPAASTPAGRVSEAIARSLSNVARACEIPLRGAATDDVLLRAFDRCGPPPAEPRPVADPSSPRSPTDFDPQAQAGGALAGGGQAGGAQAGGAQAGGTQAGGGAAPPGPRAPVVPKAPALPTDNGPGAACMNGCTSEHNTCKGRCGKEPAQSSLYEAYQACLGRCLASASKCRLSCK